jgi:hypothetical protein
MVFVFYTESADALPTVDIKSPQWDSMKSRDTREEACKRRGLTIIFYDEISVAVKRIVNH